MNDARWLSRSEQVYRLLLCLYPQGFRRLHEEEMALDFRDLCRDALGGQHDESLVGLWLRTTADLLSSAIRERLRQTTYRSKPHMDTTASFDNQLAATLDYWSRAMRSGYSIKQVFELLAQRAPQPTAQVFRAVLDDAAESGDFPGAVARLREQVDSVSFGQVIDTVLRQRETGGNLADLLDGLTADLRAAGGENWSSGVGFEE